jgi:preprotein translocase subunit YajC
MEMFGQLLPFIFLIAIMYFIIIRPQQQQAKKHKEMVAGLKKGDKIVTSGGLIAEVKKVEEEFFSVEIAGNVAVKLTKDAVARKYEDEA